MTDNPIRRFLRPSRPWVWLIGLLSIYHLAGVVVAPLVAERQLGNFAEQRLGLDASLYRIRINPYSFSMQIEQLEITDAEPLLSFDNLRLNIQPLSYIRARQIHIRSLEIFGLSVSLQRFEDGATNIERLQERFTETAIEEDTTTESQTNTEPVELLISSLALVDASLSLRDEALEIPLDFQIEQLQFHLTDFSSLSEQAAKLELELDVASGGSLEVSGNIGLAPEFNSSLLLSLDRLSLTPLHSYLSETTQIAFASGVLNLEGTADITSEEPFAFQGSTSIEDLDLEYLQQPLLTWDEISLPQNFFSLAENRLEVSEIVLYQAFARTIINQTGATNIGEALSGDSLSNSDNSDASELVADSAIEESSDAAPPSDAMRIEIDSILVNEAEMFFADYSLPLPFIAEISGLNGEVSAISNLSSAPAALDLGGQVGDFGLVSINGQLRPLQPQELTQIELAFENIEMLDLSPYLIKFAGRAIESGKLDVDLNYQINSSQLQGNNQMVMRDFSLGETVESPDALNLPLGLAIALLKNSDDVIDLELPVSGDLSDPQFSFGSIIQTAFTNLIGNIVSSPFRFLGGLIGSEEPLDNIVFDAGSSELRPPEQEKLIKLVSALAERPQITLGIAPTFNRAIDSLALRENAVEDRVTIRVEAITETGLTVLDQRIQALESLVLEADATEALANLRALHSQPLLTTATDGSSQTEELDRPAYAADLELWLVQSENIDESQYLELATLRAQKILDYLLETESELAARIEVSGDISSLDESSENVTVLLSLTNT